MKSLNELLILPTYSIKEAMEVLNSTSKQILLIVDGDKRLIGTLTDGDIRRALLNGLNLSSHIESVMNKNPLVGRVAESKNLQIKLLKKHHLKSLPIVDEQNRLMDILFLEDIIAEQRSTKVVLMAGGLGLRLRPLTEHTPKPMLKVGKYPILETILRRFKKQGFENFTIAVNYKKEVIQNYFQDGQMLDVNIEYLHENKRLGTAGALSLLSEVPENPIIVMNGDLLTNLNFNELLENHITSGAVATVCVRKHQYQVPYGVINEKEACLTSIVEKPTHEYLTNAGIYVLNPSVLNMIPKNEFYDMPELLNALLVKQLSVNVKTIKDYWLDIGQIDDFNKANLDMKDESDD